MLDDLTSGYNIAQILTLNPKYNEMMSFTQEEVEWLMVGTGIDPQVVGRNSAPFLCLFCLVLT
jgi:hypothetical protein